MKHIILLISLCLFSLFSLPPVFAQTPTTKVTPTIKTTISPTPGKTTPTPTGKTVTEKSSEIINDLKERIASKVAQLNLVKRKGIIGTVTDVSGTQITINDIHNNTKYIDVDELTKFASPSAKESFGLSDLTKGTKIGILGLHNKQSRRMLARFIDVTRPPLVLHGALASTDAKNFSLEMVTEDGKNYTVDVENITKTLSFTKEDGLLKAGFSKIKPDQHIIIVGFQDVKNKDRILASRILLFPELPRNPKVTIPSPALDPEATTVPSTGSGKKLTPLTR